MPWCCPRTASAMPRDLSCGRRGTSLGMFARSRMKYSCLPAACSNHIPWIIIGICYACCIVIMLSIRLLLSRENKRRDLEPRDTTYDDIYIERVIDGKVMQVKVEKVRYSVLLLFAVELTLSTRNSLTSQTSRIGSIDMSYKPHSAIVKVDGR